jgi:hypothetical protein
VAVQTPIVPAGLAVQSAFVQQWDGVPVPPPVQMSTHPPVVVSHFRFVPQVTPVQTPTHVLVASHF